MKVKNVESYGMFPGFMWTLVKETIGFLFFNLYMAFLKVSPNTKTFH